MKNYKVSDAVWIATALLSFNKYYSMVKPNKEDMFFKQTEDIQKTAEKFCNQKVDNARISQWTNGDHSNSNYNYLRVCDKNKRRLTFPGEFNGVKERPYEINIDDEIETILGMRKLKDIIEFVNNEYKGLMIDTNTSTKVNFKGILDFLDKYAECNYKKINKIFNMNRKSEIQETVGAWEKASKEFNKIFLEINKRYNKYNGFYNKTWLDVSDARVRKYFWIELKKSDRKDSPTSISIFAEKLNDNISRFRVGLELKENKSKLEDYKRHHRFLKMDVSQSKVPLQYICSSKSSDVCDSINISSKEIEKGLNEGKFNKIQLCYILSREDIDNNNLSNNDIQNELLKAISVIEPYYDYVFQRDDKTFNKDEEVVEQIVNNDKNIILYGPAGTGKTFNTVNYAVAIIENKSIDEVIREKHINVIDRYNKYKQEGRIVFITFHQSYEYDDFIEGIKPNCDYDNKSLIFTIRDGIFKKFCRKASNHLHNTRKYNYVFIIDEINRGNISKIFGEMFTLIESNKRLSTQEQLKATLPYSGEEFGIPDNIYILGTMNTTDRAGGIMDTVLRRRFMFIEMMPDIEFLRNVNVGSINLEKMLKVINERIEILYDRDHTIGQAYFVNVKINPSLEELANVFKNKIIPLLQEYFHEDYRKIQLILGDNYKDTENRFILDTEIQIKNVFKGNPDINISPKKYNVQMSAFYREESYIQIYL